MNSNQLYNFVSGIAYQQKLRRNKMVVNVRYGSRGAPQNVWHPFFPTTQAIAHSNFTQLGFGKYSVAKSIRKIGRGSVHCATGAPKKFFVYLCECISNAQSLLTFVAVLITCKPRSTQTLSNSADKSSSVSIARSPESSASSISANTLRTAVSVECIALYAD